MRLSLFWRVFAVNAGLLGGIAVLLLVTPVEINSPISTTQALIVVGGLAITLVTDALLLRRSFMPLEQLARRMETVDLLRPGQRLPVGSGDEVGRVVAAFNQMLDRLESERHENGRRVLAAQEAERIGIARDLHDEVGQLLTGCAPPAELDRRDSAHAPWRDRPGQGSGSQRPRRGTAHLERAPAGDARAPGSRERADRAVDDVRAGLRRAGRAPVRRLTAAPRPRMPSSPSTASRRRA